ncbi:glycerophosphodiester phosphodiesterase family protein [Marinobacterium aestuariivivens]|uniref:Glycerophosphodiester phosphodiesterase family protein n=1 Tax=Marinobacterium aestuariivivens TaxID=1698799 RepID=A0ABW2A2T8_9GAMM
MATFAERLVAHRGYAARYPENTLKAVREALEAGARFVEVDIQLTADREPVLFHDGTLQRLCGEPGAIHCMKAERLAALRSHYPGRFGLRFTDEPIARLAQLTELILANPAAEFFIELKPEAIGHFGRDEVLQAVTAELEPCRRQCILISYDREILRLAAAAGWRIGAVEKRWPSPGDRQYRSLAPEFLFVDFRDLPNGSLKLDGVRLAVFEVAEPGLARALMARGVELVETFEIGEMRRALTRNASP